MNTPPTSDFATVVGIVADVGARVLGDAEVWYRALCAVREPGAQWLQWPQPEGRTGYQRLLGQAFRGYVAQSLACIAQTEPEVPPVDARHEGFQIVLQVARLAADELDRELVRWAKAEGLIHPLRGVRDFRNWMKAEAASEAVAQALRQGERISGAIARTGFSKSAAYRAMGRAGGRRSGP